MIGTESRDSNLGVQTIPSAPLLVDTHAHVYLTSMPPADSAWHLPPQDATIEAYTGLLAQHGVSRAVIAAASIFGDYSAYTLEALAKHSNLRATVIVRPDVGMDELESLKSRGVVGIRFQWRTLSSIPDIQSKPYQRILGLANELDWHVHVHDDAPRLATYLPHLERSGVKLVLDHFGRPTVALGVECDGFAAILKSIERGRTWVKLSASFRLGSPSLAKSVASRLLEVGTTERLFWGSDWPFAAFENTMTYAQAIRAFEQIVEDPQVRQRIGENASRFYFGDLPDVR